jgi:cytochrome oxidase assembly protein ShyY1
MWFDLGLFLVMATAFVTFVVTEWQMSKEREKKSKEFWR